MSYWYDQADQAIRAALATLPHGCADKALIGNVVRATMPFRNLAGSIDLRYAYNAWCSARRAILYQTYPNLFPLKPHEREQPELFR